MKASANDGCTALMLAASSGDSEVVRYVLSKGADLSARFIVTETRALMLAKEKDHTEIAKLLQAAGADESHSRSRSVGI